jgi:hypothetical protein
MPEERLIMIVALEFAFNLLAGEDDSYLGNIRPGATETFLAFLPVAGVPHIAAAVSRV